MALFPACLPTLPTCTCTVPLLYIPVKYIKYLFLPVLVYMYLIDPGTPLAREFSSSLALHSRIPKSRGLRHA